MELRGEARIAEVYASGLSRWYDAATMMARTQISLDPEQHRRARDKAAALGVSLAEYVRRLVAADLGEVKPGARVEDLFDLGDSGGSDISRHKDEYLAQAIAADKNLSR
jgi:hypothetical protein